MLRFLIVLSSILLISLNAQAANKQKTLGCLLEYLGCEMRTEECEKPEYENYAYKHIESLSQEDQVQKQTTANNSFNTIKQQVMQSIVEQEVKCRELPEGAIDRLPEDHCCKNVDENNTPPETCLDKKMLTIDEKIDAIQKSLTILHKMNLQTEKARNPSRNFPEETEDFDPCGVKK